MLSTLYLSLTPLAEADNHAWGTPFLVFDPAAEGLSWTAMAEPTVLYLNGVYNMWFRYLSGDVAYIAYMNSSNGQNWENLTYPVLSYHTESYVLYDDEYGIMLTTLNTTSWLYDLFNSSISAPNNWHVIKYGLFPLGSSGQWDHQYFGNPSLTRASDGTWIFYYEARASASDQLWRCGYANSTDLLTWTKCPTNPTMTDNNRGAGGPDLRICNGTDLLLYHGGNLPTDLKIANSTNINSWTIIDDPILTRVAPYTYSDSQYADPDFCLNSNNGTWIFFTGVIHQGTLEKFFALHTDSDLWSLYPPAQLNEEEPDTMPPNMITFNYKLPYYMNNNISVSGHWTDDSGLSHYRYYLNVSGSWEYTDWTAFPSETSPQWSEYKFNLTGNEGDDVGVIIYANDTYGNLGESYMLNLTLTKPPIQPTYSVIGHSGSTGGASANFYLYADDDDPGLASYIFSYRYGSSSYNNLTQAPFTSTPGWANLTRALPLENTTCYFLYYFCDLSGNWAVTDEQSFTVTYITPPELVENVITSAHITAQPENVSYGQYVQISVQIYPPPPTPEDVFKNLTVLFLNPLQGVSGHYSFIKGPSSTDANGSQSFSGQLTDSGYWSVELHFPGQFFVNDTIYYQPGDWHIMVYVSPPSTPSPSPSPTPQPTISPSPSPTASPSPSPSPTPLPNQEPFLIINVAGTVIALIVVGAGLLVYFKKRKH
jgi:hypothetical protein